MIALMKELSFPPMISFSPFSPLSLSFTSGAMLTVIIHQAAPSFHGDSHHSGSPNDMDWCVCASVCLRKTIIIILLEEQSGCAESAFSKQSGLAQASAPFSFFMKTHTYDSTHTQICTIETDCSAAFGPQNLMSLLWCSTLTRHVNSLETPPMFFNSVPCRYLLCLLFLIKSSFFIFSWSIFLLPPIYFHFLSNSQKQIFFYESLSSCSVYLFFLSSLTLIFSTLLLPFASVLFTVIPLVSNHCLSSVPVTASTLSLCCIVPHLYFSFVLCLLSKWLPFLFSTLFLHS